LGSVDPSRKDSTVKLARLTATLMAVVALGACSDDPEPKVGPPSDSASSSLSPSSAVQEHAERQLIQKFVAGVSAALSTGDPSTFLSLAGPDCRNCQKLAHNLSAGFSHGGRIVGGSWTVVHSELEQSQPDGSLWYVDVRSTKEKWLDAEGAVLKVVDAGLQLLAFDVRDSDTALLVNDLRVRQ
jgi:hypothetical protein